MSQAGPQSRLRGMSIRLHRWSLALLALSALYLACWAVCDPHSFYVSFPGFRHGWVSSDGPYNEHLIRDVGGLYLALGVLSAGAWIRPEPSLVRLTGLAWAPFSVLHLAYHAAHADGLSAADRVADVVALGATLLLASALLLPWRARPTPPNDPVATRVATTRGR